MGSEEADRLAAKNMIKAAANSGVERIIYLGGLAEANQGELSKHLLSRIEVAQILQSGPVPTTDLRAGAVAGCVPLELTRRTPLPNSP